MHIGHGLWLQNQRPPGGGVDPFALYVGDMSGTGLTDPAVITQTGGVVSAVAATGSAGLILTSQGTGADILAVPGGLQFTTAARYLRALITRTIRRVQIAVEYTLLGASAGSAFPVEVQRNLAASRARVQLNPSTGAGLLILRGPADQVLGGSLPAYYGVRETQVFEIDLPANVMRVVGADNWQDTAVIAAPPANIPVSEIRIGTGCNAIFHKVAILMEDV